MKQKHILTIVMENGVKYEYFNTLEFDIRDNQQIKETLQGLGFFKTRNINDINMVALGLKNGKNVLVDERKITSYEFQMI